MNECDVPIVLIAFNRPLQTNAILKSIKAVKAKRLYVLVDGHRPDRPGEEELISQVIAQVKKYEGEFQIFYNISEVNLGIRQRVITGLDWVFSLEESAIILEDDCIPDPSFFGYCSELLKHFRDDSEIGVISGFRASPESQNQTASYSYSNFSMTWGWATWRRVWDTFDKSGSTWTDKSARTRILNSMHGQNTRRYWSFNLSQATRNQNHAGWDYLFTLSQWVNNRINIIPQRSLIKNVGFTMDATHTRDPNNPLASVGAGSIALPLTHPREKKLDKNLDLYLEKNIFNLGITKLVILRVLWFLNSKKLNDVVTWARWKVTSWGKAT